MTPQDARLVAALTLLRDQLPGVVDELLGGELDQADRSELARALRIVADQLARPPMVALEPSEAPDRSFSNSGP